MIMLINQKKIIILIAIFVFLAGAIGYYIVKYSQPSQPFNQDLITRQGIIICFPSRGTAMSDEWDCDIGLRADDGKYYELENLDAVVPGGEGSLAGGQRVKISGTLVSLPAKYDSDGVIYVSQVITEEETIKPISYCETDRDCGPNQVCADISPVARGVMPKRCWNKDTPLPICLAENTLIDTPDGQRPVEELEKGMLVWTIDAAGNRVVAPIEKIGKTSASERHKVIRLLLKDGRELFVSAGHPLNDGRLIGALKTGDIIDGSSIAELEYLLYQKPYTYDILPDSETGAYWANRIPLKSTLR